MAWSDDPRCLYCDGKLPLYRKFTQGQFCSASHRRKYWKEQERLAVERLDQTQRSLSTHHSPEVLKAVLGKSPDEPIHQAELLPVIEEIARVVSNTDGVVKPGFLRMQNRPIDGGIHQQFFEHEASDSAPNAPVFPSRRSTTSSNEPSLARSVKIKGISAVRAAISNFFQPAPQPYVIVQQPKPRVARNVTPEATELQPKIIDIAAQAPGSLPKQATEPDYPFADTSIQLPKPSARDYTRFTLRCNALPVEFRATAPKLRARTESIASYFASTGLRPILPKLVALPAPSPRAFLAPADLKSHNRAMVSGLAARSNDPNLRYAPGSRYAIQNRQGVITPNEITPEAGSFDQIISFVPEGSANLRAELAPTALAPLSFSAKPVAPPSKTLTEKSFQFEVSGEKPRPPALRLNPLEGESVPPPKGFFGLRGINGLEHAHIWAQAGEFWRHAPRDYKLLMIAIPVLLALVLHPSLPKVRVAAPKPNVQIQTDLGGQVQTRFASFQQTIANRAGVELNDDFRSGLDDWQTRGDLSASWSFDRNGFVKPGPLALYRPSMGLADYEMQFLGLIDQKAISFVSRAQDFDNYYVVKIVVLKSGPLPKIGITRYAVINGKADKRKDVIAPINARLDTLYRVGLDVHDDTFLLTIQGQVADTWSEPRLKRGGIGFFAANGEESRLRWVQVTHQYDMLGRLCAYLAPYNIPTTNGSW